MPATPLTVAHLCCTESLLYLLLQPFIHINKKTVMGRGDKKTKKGKIFKGSFGKSRPASEKKTTGNAPGSTAKKEA